MFIKRFDCQLGSSEKPKISKEGECSFCTNFFGLPWPGWAPSMARRPQDSSAAGACSGQGGGAGSWVQTPGPWSPLQLLPGQQRRPRQAAGLGGVLGPASRPPCSWRAGFAEHHHFSRAVCSSCQAQAKPLRVLHGPPTVCCLVPEAPRTLWPFSWLGFPSWALRQVKCWVARGLACFLGCHPAWPLDFTSCPPSSLLTSKSKASPGLASGVG